MDTDKNTKEGRGYFRITDWMGFEYKPLDEVEYRRLRQVSQYAEVPALDELAEIDQQLQLVLTRLDIKLPYAADLGRLLNKKIQLIMRQTSIAKNMVDLDSFEQTQVDISATGMAFPSRSAIISGQSLRIDLILQSGRQHLKLLAKVVSCALDNELLADGDASFTHVVRVNFSDMSEDVSEFLIQYLVKRQGALLKSERLNK
jgi:hypothetical protein